MLQTVHGQAARSESRRPRERRRRRQHDGRHRHRQHARGVITASFGTSGTIYACAEKPVVDPEGEIAAFCDSTNRWLPLLCTMNVTVATEMVREDFGWTHEKFAATNRARPGRLRRPAAAAVSRRRTHAECSRRHRRLVWRESKNFRRRTFRARGDGRRDAGDELRPAPPGRAWA